MKKEYQKPVMTVVVLLPTPILAGTNGNKFHNKSVNANQAMGRKNGDWDDEEWDDEEWDDEE